MTKAERQQFREDVYKQALRHVTRRMGLFSTTRQLVAGAKKLTDQIVAQTLKTAGGI